MTKVFVYGTLKREFSNHPVLQAACCEFLCEDTIPIGEFTMLDLGWFPALIESADGSEISGEVFEVESLEPLDQLEGYPRFYNRRVVTTGSGQQAWVYFIENQQRSRDVLTSGKWEK